MKHVYGSLRDPILYIPCGVSGMTRKLLKHRCMMLVSDRLIQCDSEQPELLVRGFCFALDRINFGVGVVDGECFEPILNSL